MSSPAARARYWSRRPALLASLLAVVVMLPSLWAGFIADDYVLLGTVRQAGGFFGAFGRNDLGQPVGSGHFYRPLWVDANWALHAVFGDRAPAFHAFNLALFALATFLVWELTRAVADDASALIATVAFAVYPRHTESAAWVSGNTDMLAAVFVLFAVVVPVWTRRRVVRIVCLAVLTAAAVLAKEVAYTLPLLIAAVQLTRTRLRREADPQSVWLLPLVTLAVEAVTFGIRWHVLGGLGGEQNHSWGVRRLAASAGSYLVGALTFAPQVDVFSHHWVGGVVVVVLAAAVWRLWSVRRDVARALPALLGVAWFAITIAPQLNIGLNLRTSNGDRLLFLPSAGLVLILASLVPRARLVLLVAAACAAAATTLNSVTWLHAGQLANRTIRQAAALGPQSGGELLVLDVPEYLGTARVIPLGLDQALARRGAPWRTAWCSTVQVFKQRDGEISFRRTSPAGFVGMSARSSPFTLPISGNAPLPLTPDCTYHSTRGAGRGRATAIQVDATPQASPVTYAYFDGRRLRLLGN